jgi:hypothetical protein
MWSTSVHVCRVGSGGGMSSMYGKGGAHKVKEEEAEK